MVPEVSIQCCDSDFDELGKPTKDLDIIYKRIKVEDISTFVNKSDTFRPINESLQLDFTEISLLDKQGKQQYYESKR